MVTAAATGAMPSPAHKTTKDNGVVRRAGLQSRGRRLVIEKIEAFFLNLSIFEPPEAAVKGYAR